MDPISALLGVGLSVIGGIMQHSAAEEHNAAQTKEIGLEQQVQDKRQQAMELAAKRQEAEIYRNQQKYRAMGLQAAVSQGASFGSGIQGAYGQFSGQTGVNLLGVTQNLEIGEQTFALNKQISQQKIAMANAGMDSQTASGISSLGSSVLGSSKAIGNLTSGFNPFMKSSS